ncbi:MAG: DUF4419 domain-containing protein [Saprospiraceae bacterium]
MKKLSTIILFAALLVSCSKSQKEIGSTNIDGSDSVNLVDGKTFKVCKVERAKTPLEEVSSQQAILNLANKKEETLYSDPTATPNPKLLCSSVGDDNMVPSHTNAFAEAAYLAYAQHRPLVISPDMIWLMITQGFALHVKENAEELRDIFVDHEGQINLDVARGSYQPSNRIWWEGIFPDFSKAIAANTKEEVWGFVAPKFSTTTLVEKAAFEITLMDAMSPYFQYSISIICGIPEITLEGEPEDWDKIGKQIEQLDSYDLNWWTDDLKNIIGEFKKASRGKINKEFWAGIFDQKNYSVGCGTSPFITGWVLDFFPYLKVGKDKEGNVKYIKNPLLKGKKGKRRTDEDYNTARMTMEKIPGGLSRAKVLLNDNGKMTTLNFNAGFVGFKQNKKTMALRPDIQWFITDLELQPTKEELEKYQKSFH